MGWVRGIPCTRLESDPDEVATWRAGSLAVRTDREKPAGVRVPREGSEGWREVCKSEELVLDSLVIGGVVIGGVVVVVVVTGRRRGRRFVGGACRGREDAGGGRDAVSRDPSLEIAVVVVDVVVVVAVIANNVAGVGLATAAVASGDEGSALEGLSDWLGRRREEGLDERGELDGAFGLGPEGFEPGRSDVPPNAGDLVEGKAARASLGQSVVLRTFASPLRIRDGHHTRCARRRARPALEQGDRRIRQSRPGARELCVVAFLLVSSLATGVFA